MTRIKGLFPGLCLCVCVAAISWFLGRLFPVVGAPVIGVALGMLLSALRKTPGLFADGIKFTSRRILQLAIIFLGFGLNLSAIAKQGAASVLIIAAVILTAFILSFLAGKLLNVPRNDKILIGIGTAICGGSAIAAAAPVIRADEVEIARSISTVFLFNVAAVFIFPLLSRILGMEENLFGTWAGLAINDTSSVMAASAAIGTAATDTAAVIKLTRTLFIVPVTLLLAVCCRSKETSGKTRLRKVFPMFILLFLLASVIHTAGVIPAAVLPFFSAAARFFITMAMVAIGLNTNVKNLLQHGKKPVIIGFCSWLGVAAVSFVLIMI